jgi:hypothetical protein
VTAATAIAIVGFALAEVLAIIGIGLAYTTDFT